MARKMDAWQKACLAKQMHAIPHLPVEAVNSLHCASHLRHLPLRDGTGMRSRLNRAT